VVLAVACESLRTDAAVAESGTVSAGVERAGAVVDVAVSDVVVDGAAITTFAKAMIAIATASIANASIAVGPTRARALNDRGGAGVMDDWIRTGAEMLLESSPLYRKAGAISSATSFMF
jgi:hypothetical protein